jgi:hypothetical protein
LILNLFVFFYIYFLVVVAIKQGTKTKMGFAFLYELFTFTYMVKILETDSGNNCASILMRLFPVEDWARPSELMSLLRVMSLNPTLASEFPKYEDSRKFKIPSMLGGKDVWGNIIKACAKVVGDKQGSLKWQSTTIGQTPPTQQVISVVSGEDMFAFNGDFNCRARPLFAVRSQVCGKSFEVPDALLSVLATSPLDPIPLSQFVTYVSTAQQGNPRLAEELPFDVSQHKSAGSHIAKSIAERLKKDVALYAASVSVS